MVVTVGKKITGGFLVVIALAGGMGGFTYYEIGESNAAYEREAAASATRMEMAQGLAIDVANEAVAMRRFNFTGDPADIPIFEAYKKQADEKVAQMKQLFPGSKYQELLLGLQKDKADYETIAMRSIASKQAGDAAGVGEHMKQAGKPYKAVMGAAQTLAAEAKALMEQDAQRQRENAVATQRLLLVMNVLIALIGLAIGIVVSRKIAGAITRLKDAAVEIAQGNLAGADLVIESEDEIGQVSAVFNDMKNSLSQLVKKIMATTEQVSAASDELTASSEQSAEAVGHVAQSIGQVAEGAETQSASVSAAAEGVGNVSTHIRQMAHAAEQMTLTAQDTAAAAHRGHEAIDIARGQMHTIEAVVRASADSVGKLGERSQEIGQIIDTIAGIAGQTNLLALNAAIEAARAGEQGRGFAVVAEEVRHLAEQSQQAAQQIAALINEIQRETAQAVTAMHTGVTEVNTGAAVVGTAEKAFKEIDTLVEGVSVKSSGISSAAAEVAAASQMVVQSIEQVGAISLGMVDQTQSVSAAGQQQAASMQQIAASSQALAKLADDLKVAVARFHV